MNKHIYISIDVEADGPIPGPFSMLQFGAAAFDLSTSDPRKPIGTYEANLELLPGASQSPATMAWWDTQGDAYTGTRTDQKTPEEAMQRFLSWANSFAVTAQITLVGYPITYDFMWLYYYTMRFGGLRDGELPPFRYNGMDIGTLAAEKLDIPFGEVRESKMRKMRKHWFHGAPEYSHNGLDDALRQGVLFVNMMLDLTPKPRPKVKAQAMTRQNIASGGCQIGQG
jgi:hypothetical protein